MSAAQDGVQDGAQPGERGWLPALALSRAFVTLIMMTYAASLPVLTREWAMTGAEAGFVQSCLLAGFGVSLFVTSWLCDHLGPGRIFLWFCWLAAAAALAFALFARSFERAAWLYAAVGATQGGCYTPAIMLVAQRLPPARRGAGIGWVLAGMSAGYVGSISLVQGLIAVSDYRVAFLACALGTLAGAVLASIAAARPAGSGVAAPGEAGPATPVPTAPLPRALLTDRRSLLLTLGYIGHSWELFGMWAWAPAFLVASLAGQAASGDLGGGLGGGLGLGLAIAAALHLSGGFASFALGQASDRYGRRPVLLGVAALGALCSFGFGWSGALPPALLLAFATLYGFAAIGDSSVLSTAMSEAVPQGYLGRGLALRSILGIGIGSAAPAAFGAVLDLSAPGAGWGWAFAVMGLGGLVAALCAALLPAEAVPSDLRAER